MKKDNQTIQKYKELIKEGKFNFVIKRGIISWGLPFSVLMYFFSVGFIFDTTEILIWLIIGGLFGGTVFGLVCWWQINKKLKTSSDKK